MSFWPCQTRLTILPKDGEFMDAFGVSTPTVPTQILWLPNRPFSLMMGAN